MLASQDHALKANVLLLLGLRWLLALPPTPPTP